MKTILVPVDELVPDPENARKHSDKNLEAIKGSLTEFGQQKPIIIDAKNKVLAGNGTLAAAKSLGWEKIAAVRSTLKGAKAMAYALADNRTAELAEWDEDKLSEQLDALSTDGDFNLQDIGFDGFSDWAPDLKGLGGEAPNLDGIVTTVRIEVPQSDKEAFLTWLRPIVGAEFPDATIS